MKVLAVLEPSSAVLQDYCPSRVPALGSALVCNLAADVVGLAEAYLTHSQSPWCPILAVVPPRLHIDSRVLEAFEPRPGALVPIVSHWINLEADPSPLRRAVIGRALPTSSMLAEYVRHRTGRRDLGHSLEVCLASGLMSDGAVRGYHRSTLGRHLRDFGPLKPRDWIAIGHVVQTLYLGLLQGARTVEGAALRVGVDPRTLRRRLHRYCACDYGQSRVRLGWEWILEAALRRFGYIGSHALPRGVLALQSDMSQVARARVSWPADALSVSRG
jgi:hypothetical protein